MTTPYANIAWNTSSFIDLVIETYGKYEYAEHDFCSG